MVVAVEAAAGMAFLLLQMRSRERRLGERTAQINLTVGDEDPVHPREDQRRTATQTVSDRGL